MVVSIEALKRIDKRGHHRGRTQSAFNFSRIAPTKREDQSTSRVDDYHMKESIAGY